MKWISVCALGLLVVIAGLTIIIVDFNVKFEHLQTEYEMLEEKYNWALELSKLTPEQREEMKEEIQKQRDI